jgi:hypothetical protein
MVALIQDLLLAETGQGARPHRSFNSSIGGTPILLIYVIDYLLSIFYAASGWQPATSNYPLCHFLMSPTPSQSLTISPRVLSLALQLALVLALQLVPLPVPLQELLLLLSHSSARLRKPPAKPQATLSAHLPRRLTLVLRVQQPVPVLQQVLWQAQYRSSNQQKHLAMHQSRQPNHRNFQFPWASPRMLSNSLSYPLCCSPH